MLVPPGAPEHGVARRKQRGRPAGRAPVPVVDGGVRVHALQQPRRVPLAATLIAVLHQHLRGRRAPTLLRVSMHSCTAV